MKKASTLLTLFFMLICCQNAKAEISKFGGRLNIAGFAEVSITGGQPKIFRLEDSDIPNHFFMGRISSAWEYMDLALSISHGTECRKTGTIKLDSEVCVQEAKLTIKFPQKFSATIGSDLAPFGISTIGIGRTGNVAPALPITSLSSPYTTFGAYLQHAPTEWFSWLAGATTWNGYLPYGENSSLVYYAGSAIKPWYNSGNKESSVNIFFATMPYSTNYGRLFFGDISISAYYGKIIALLETHAGSAHNERMAWVSASALLGLRLPKIYTSNPLVFFAIEGYGHKNPDERATPTGMLIPRTIAGQIGIKIEINPIGAETKINPMDSAVKFNASTVCSFENKDSVWCKIQVAAFF
jgi:hypothetical protein